MRARADAYRSKRRPRRPAILGGAIGATAGLVGAVAALALVGTAVAHRLDAADEPPGSLIEATHLPPLLTLPGEVAQLRYDIYCAAPDGDPESGRPCDARGTAYVRAGNAGPFRAVPLRLDTGASEGRYVADLPADVASARDGFAYYAVVRNETSGATATLPAAGALAPQRSRPLERAVDVSLGPHAFGRARTPSARVAAASWGHGPGDVGLEPGPQEEPIGASSFDVDASGTVTVLDEANRRALRFVPGAAQPLPAPLAIRGTIADLAVEADGGLDVLETVGDGRETPLVRSFDAQGRARGATHLAEHGASALRAAPGGAVALQYPAGQWMPVVSHGAGIAPAAQRAGARAGRPLPGGGEILAQREANEARVALLDGGGRVRRSWRIRSDTTLGEVQLAEPLGNRVVVVLRVYSETEDEFEALVLGDKGLEQAFSIDSSAWAETAPLARFRLRGSSLFELGSTPGGAFVDRYDLEVS